MNEERNELNSPSGSGYLDGFPEPEVAYTRRKALSGSFKCRCVKGAWCYAKGGKRPCDAGLMIPPPMSCLVRFRKWFFHDIMGWHNCKGGNGSFDGCSQHAKCSCGKEVMQDGQGNWF